ncbi:xanthine dehydrogenase molybdenum-binding subunit XdhA [Clostridia bacterium]|nr:xanthine dehydrogenase molybdenum-binding subunit XdhA [Clostridia bacterium]
MEFVVSDTKPKQKKEYQHIGQVRTRTDAKPKVTGKAKYIADTRTNDMLYGKILWSTKAHANIKSIDTAEAEKLSGVHSVLTWKDMPRVKYCPQGHPFPDDSPRDKYILDNKVRFVGDYVAAVAAETPEIANQAVKLIKVEYEELPSVFSPEKAIQVAADNKNAEIHEGTGNLLDQNFYEFGDVKKGFSTADLVFEDEFRTPIVQHCPIETHITKAYFEDSGRLVVHASTQIAFHLRRILSQALDMPIGNIRVVADYVGGGFGSKEDVTLEPITAMLAIKTKRPVLLEFSREENMVSTRTRHSTIIKLKTGITKDGKITTRTMDVLSNTGAYAAHGHGIVYNMSAQFPNLYPTDNISFKGTSVYTNIPVASAMRSYGISQLNFAMESHMDNIAKKMGMDPIELRRRNIIKLGFKDPQNYFTIDSCGVEECIRIGENLTNWKKKRARYAKETGEFKKGLGMACFSYGSNTFPFNEEIAGARIKLNEDGSATLFIGASEIGQGSNTVMAQIAAEELGISYNRVKVISVDTDICPFDLGAYASRQTNMTGAAVYKAAVMCREDLLKYTAEAMKVDVDTLIARDDWIWDKNTDEKLIEISKAAMNAYYHHSNPIAISHEIYHKPNNDPLSFGAVFVDVAVDSLTGKINIKKIWAIHDSGTIINHKQAEGQVEGGVSMGLAYGLSEQILIDPKTGKVLNDNLLDYKIPTVMDMPELDVIFVETNEPSTAYGQKSLGEPPVVSVAPAIRNAVLNALGVPLNEIPLTPQRVFEGLTKMQEA